MLAVNRVGQKCSVAYQIIDAYIIMNSQLLQKIQDLLKDHPAASNFIQLYSDYVHKLDDLIDEQSCKEDSEFILELNDLSNVLFSHPFYIANIQSLQILMFVITNEFADSIHWEKSGVKWKIEAAGTLRHAAIMVFYAVILICCGRKELRKISLEFREHTFLKHLEDSEFIVTTPTEANVQAA